MYVDLAAERLIVAERGQERIAVEIKTFGGASDVVSLEQAIGQYCVYRAVMEETQRNYLLYLAVHAEAFFDVLDEPLGRLLLRKYEIPVIVFDPEREVILEWIHWNTTDT
ncbi:fdxN element excision controlling factor protein [Leptolyngbya sp. NIES-2104]|nr:fdxN element excision controlling factor protein [Leptolyngbya sp. NIES-2104]